MKSQRELLNTLKKVLETITNENDSNDYKMYFPILKSKFIMDKNYKDIYNKIRNLRYHGKNDFESEGDMILKKALCEMKINNLSKLDDFKDKVNEQIEIIIKKYPITKYEIYYPVNLKFDRIIEPIKIKTDVDTPDDTIEFKKYDEIKNIFKLELVKKSLETPPENLKKFFTIQHSPFFENKEKYQYIKITIYCRDEYYALNTAKRYINGILGIINYYRYYTMGVPESQIVNYDFVIYTYNNRGHFSYTKNQSIKDISNDILDLNYLGEIRDLKGGILDISELLNLFSHAKPEIKELLLNLFGIYQMGMTEEKLYNSYIHFWTVLEVASLKNRKDKHKDIIKRLKSIYLEDDQLFFDHLEVLYHTRNEIVHKGGYHLVSEYYRDSLKCNVDIMLAFLVNELIEHDCDLGKIKLVYSYLQKDLKELENIKDTINHVIELKDNHENEN